MKIFFGLFYSLLILLLLSFTPGRFKTDQQKYSRVRVAYQEKREGIRKMLESKHIHPDDFEIFLRAFKEEEIVELWSRNKGNEKWTYIKSYTVCQSSGDLGPKRRQGDGQVPEGFYHIDGFNPQSNFYLSLRINYPNASDKILGSTNPGGDIFIHGNCVSIGCLPLTDFFIKELYILAVEAKDRGQLKIPIHIFPFKMSDEKWKSKKKDFEDNQELIVFWENIRKGYNHFENNKTLPKVNVLQNGIYNFNY